MKIVNLFPLSIIQEKISLEENTKSEMKEEIETMVSKSKNKEYKNKNDSWTGDTQGFEYLQNMLLYLHRDQLVSNQNH